MLLLLFFIIQFIFIFYLILCNLYVCVARTSAPVWESACVLALCPRVGAVCLRVWCWCAVFVFVFYFCFVVRYYFLYIYYFICPLFCFLYLCNLCACVACTSAPVCVPTYALAFCPGMGAVCLRVWCWYAVFVVVFFLFSFLLLLLNSFLFFIFCFYATCACVLRVREHLSESQHT